MPLLFDVVLRPGGLDVEGARVLSRGLEGQLAFGFPLAVRGMKPRRVELSTDCREGGDDGGSRGPIATLAGNWATADIANGVVQDSPTSHSYN